MSYTSIPSIWIQPGAPTKKELFERISDNLEDHESRITVVEGVTNVTKVEPFTIIGDYAGYSLSAWGSSTLDLTTGILHWRTPVAITLLAARLVQTRAGQTGTTTFDLEYSANGTSGWASIFSTLPSITSANGDNYVSSNAVLSTTSIPAGGWLRMNLIGRQTHVPFDAVTSILLEYEDA